MSFIYLAFTPFAHEYNFNPSSHHSHLILSLGHLDAAEEHLAAAVPAALVRPPDLAEKEDITPLVS